MTSRIILGRTLLGLGTIALAGCDALDPTSFDRISGTAEIVVASSPGGGNGATGFGAVLVGFGTSVPDAVASGRRVRASRYAVSSGAGGPYSVFAVFDESVLDAHSTTGLFVTAGPDARYSGCVAGQFCGPGSSVSVATTAIWHQDASTTRSGCVIVPSGNAVTDSRTGERHEQFQVRCEPTSTSIQPMTVPVEQVELGVSATSLPVDHPLGAAIFGAPGDAGGNGALYRVDDYPINDFIRVPMSGTPVGAGLGRTLASTTLADGTVLLATGGRGRPDDPVVVVATLDPAGGPAVVRACLRGHGTRFGSALAFGNFDGDGVPDLAIGAGVWQLEEVSSQHVDQPIVLYSGGALTNGRAMGCEDPPTTTVPPARTLDCLNDAAMGAHCAAGTSDAYTGFGASLATGDVNADGRDDLIVGVPLSSVRSAGGGTVLVLVGGASFDALGATEHSFLTYSSQSGSANLGATVATVPGVDRAEIVAGAPGAGRVAVFFCSGVRGDRPEDFAGVAGVTHGCVVGARPQADVDSGTTPIDAGTRDGGMDAGVPDAGDVDVGAADAGADDGGEIDAGTDAG